MARCLLTMHGMKRKLGNVAMLVLLGASPIASCLGDDDGASGANGKGAQAGSTHAGAPDGGGGEPHVGGGAPSVGGAAGMGGATCLDTCGDFPAPGSPCNACEEGNYCGADIEGECFFGIDTYCTSGVWEGEGLPCLGGAGGGSGAAGSASAAGQANGGVGGQ